MKEQELIPGALVGASMLLKVEPKDRRPSEGNWVVLEDGTVLVCASGGVMKGFDGREPPPGTSSVVRVVEPDLVPMINELERLEAIIAVATDLAARELELYGDKSGLARIEAVREARFLKRHLERLRQQGEDPVTEVLRLRSILADACYHAEYVADMPLPAQSARARRNVARLRGRAETLNRMRCDLRSTPSAPKRLREDLEMLIGRLVGG
jgi:hypothetical protein